MTNYFTNAMIHESGKFQQMFLAKTDHFCSLDKVLDIFKAHPCRSQPVQIQKSLPACSNPIPNSPTSNFDLIVKIKHVIRKMDKLTKINTIINVVLKSTKKKLSIILKNSKLKIVAIILMMIWKMIAVTMIFVNSLKLDTKQDSSAKKFNLPN